MARDAQLAFTFLVRQGRLFADRYHSRALKTPRAVHFALRYVLLNVRKHQTSAAGGERWPTVPAGFIDSCSSAPWFDNFERPDGLAFGVAQARAQWRASSGVEAPVALAQTWLLRRGSRFHGGFDIDDIPGAH